MLFGRDDDLTALSRMLDGVGDGHGGALVLRGGVGTGKSTLLAVAAATAAERQIRVLHTAVEPDRPVRPFGALTHLMAQLPRPPREDGPLRLLRDDGLRETAAGDLGGPAWFRLALAVVEALAGHPTVLVADDGQWVDEPSWQVLASIGRRLDLHPVGLLTAMRDAPADDSRLAASGLPELMIAPLTRSAAGLLLDHVVPGLPAPTREWVLAAACGNPLAVIEFGRAAAQSGSLPWLPVSAATERLFADRVDGLPAATRVVLLTAALGEGRALSEILAAATTVDGYELDVADLDPAVSAGLLDVDDQFRLRLRHPLLRSVLWQRSNPVLRSRIHAALGAEPVDDGERRRWGPDALMRAAVLSEDPRQRTRLLLSAMEVAAHHGDLDVMQRAIHEAEAMPLDPAERARLSWMRESAADPGVLSSDDLARLLELVDRINDGGDPHAALDSLAALAARFNGSPPDAATRDAFVAIAESIRLPAEDLRLVALLAMADPLGRGSAVLERLTGLSRHMDNSPYEQYLLGVAANALGAFDLAATLYMTARPGLRAQGRLAVLTRALVGQAWTAVQLGNVRLATSTAATARALAVRTRQPMVVVTADLVRAQVEALRGNGRAARELADAADRTVDPSGAHPWLAMAAVARGVAALGERRPGEAFRELRRLFDGTDRAYHPYLRHSVFGLLAEAGHLGGRHAEIVTMIDEIEPVADRTRSPILRHAVAYARAVTAPDDDAPERYRRALTADLAAWPFELARLELAHGTWLRRHRRATEAREALRSAVTALDALGVDAWAARARRELRSVGGPAVGSADRSAGLTVQQRRIANLAADGLSNLEIAERLFLSPRTVTTHLSRIYAKVAANSRTDLARILARQPGT